jgi:hypothetical protein
MPHGWLTAAQTYVVQVDHTASVWTITEKVARLEHVEGGRALRTKGWALRTSRIPGYAGGDIDRKDRDVRRGPRQSHGWQFTSEACSVHRIDDEVTVDDATQPLDANA